MLVGLAVTTAAMRGSYGDGPVSFSVGSGISHGLFLGACAEVWLMTLTDEELRLRRLAASGDVEAQLAATVLARRRGETGCIVLDETGREIAYLNPDEDSCRPGFSSPCGGCDACGYLQAIHGGFVILDARQETKESSSQEDCFDSTPCVECGACGLLC
jgi:hypothetical protein